MKYFTLIIALFVLLGCSENVSTYNDALRNCEVNKKSVWITGLDSSEIVVWPSSCIEGYPLPNFKLQSIDGDVISTESLKGKLSIINFWFENCPPCIAEIPGLNQIKQKFGTNDVNYIAISTDAKHHVEEFLAKKDFNFTHIANGNSIYRDTFSATWGYPFTIVSNRRNIILKSFGGGPSDSTAIEAIVSKIDPILIAEKAKR